MASLTAIVVHTFTMGDVEDPDIFAADPIWKWQQTELGKYVMKRAAETPVWHRDIDRHSMGWRYSIVAKFDERSLVEYYLRGGENYSPHYDIEGK